MNLSDADICRYKAFVAAAADNDATCSSGESESSVIDDLQQGGIAILNGMLVNADISYPADIYLRDGKVQAIVDRSDGDVEIMPNYETVIDASNKYVMPGGIDPHTHMEIPVRDITQSIGLVLTNNDDSVTLIYH